MFSAHTQTLALIGAPVSHSVTPRAQNAALQEIGANVVNLAFRVEPESLETAVRGAQALGFLGLMVTIPHKEAVLEFCDELHPSARTPGAANLLVFRPDGRIEGHSSDGWGAIQSLREKGIEVREQKIVILGGGGSARSLALTFALEGASEIVLLNRTVERAQKIADEVRALGIRAEVASTPEAALDDAALLVNTTSVGMTPHAAETPLDRRFLRPGLPVFDIVYNPLETRLLREAREIGAVTVDGLDMVLLTSVYAVRECAGMEISLATMRAAALEALKN